MKQVQLKYFNLILYIIWMRLDKVKLKPFPNSGFKKNYQIHLR